jgi:hypothetical protein
MGKLRFYKCTGANGIAHYDGATRYSVGATLAVDKPDSARKGACGRGLHVVSHLAHVTKYVDVDLRQCEFYLVEVSPDDVIASDETKTRVRSLRVIRSLREADVGILRGRLDEILAHSSGSGYGYGYGYGYGSLRL